MGRDNTSLNRDKIINSRTRKCRNCQRGPDDADLEIHHIVPRDAGGEDKRRNTAILCSDCHRAAHIDDVTAPNSVTQADFNEFPGGGAPRDGYDSSSRNLTDFSDNDEKDDDEEE